jgi:hypothetical protein
MVGRQMGGVGVWFLPSFLGHLAILCEHEQQQKSRLSSSGTWSLAGVFWWDMETRIWRLSCTIDFLCFVLFCFHFSFPTLSDIDLRAVTKCRSGSSSYRQRLETLDDYTNRKYLTLLILDRWRIGLALHAQPSSKVPRSKVGRSTSTCTHVPDTRRQLTWFLALAPENDSVGIPR